MRIVTIVTAVILIIGGLNWGLIGLFHFNAVDRIFGEMSLVSRIIYGLVGVSALYQAIAFREVGACWFVPRVSGREPRPAH